MVNLELVKLMKLAGLEHIKEVCDVQKKIVINNEKPGYISTLVEVRFFIEHLGMKGFWETDIGEILYFVSLAPEQLESFFSGIRGKIGLVGSPNIGGYVFFATIMSCQIQ